MSTDSECPSGAKRATSYVETRESDSRGSLQFWHPSPMFAQQDIVAFHWGPGPPSVPTATAYFPAERDIVAPNRHNYFPGKLSKVLCVPPTKWECVDSEHSPVFGWLFQFSSNGLHRDRITIATRQFRIPIPREACDNLRRNPHSIPTSGFGFRSASCCSHLT